MNLFRLPSLVFLSVAAFYGSTTAQTSPNFQGETAFVSTTSNASGHSASATEISPAYRFHKKLAQTYSGYAIEVAASNYPLQRDNPVFRQFGNIFYEKLSEGGYSYLVKAEFSSREAALNFVETIVVPKAPEARLFEYKEGTRKIVRN